MLRNCENSCGCSPAVDREYGVLMRYFRLSSVCLIIQSTAGTYRQMDISQRTGEQKKSNKRRSVLLFLLVRHFFPVPRFPSMRSWNPKDRANGQKKARSKDGHKK